MRGHRLEVACKIKGSPGDPRVEWVKRNWIRLAVTEQQNIQLYWLLSGAPDPEPALSSQRQLNDALQREFTVLSYLPAS
ncbi:MAG: hypothetical protein IGR76_06745 [Synechococcales cyanobacterium T60_A2020_003]|nr:hypothetical protein [Synechococcales cyanobacterium T60_A2020_003]